MASTKPRRSQDEFNCDHDWLYPASEYPKHALLDLRDAMMSR